MTQTKATMLAGNQKRRDRHAAAKLAMICWKVVRFAIIFGLAFMILRPFIEKIAKAFMDPVDLLDSTVWLIPRNFSTHYWEEAWVQLKPFVSGKNTLILSLSIGVIQMLVCTSIGYGLARFKFVGRGLARFMVIVILLIPQQVYAVAQFLQFRFFGPFNLTESFIPMFLLAFCGLGLKEGLYIYLMTTFFEGLPRELENAAYIDGASPFYTFVKVMLPNALTMMTTVFLFSFCWQWTDTSYQFMRSVDTIASVLPRIWVRVGLQPDYVGTQIVRGAACIIILIPLIVLFVFCQRSLVKSISTSGQAN